MTPGETYTGSRAPEIAAGVAACLEPLACPYCGQEVWDLAYGSKLAKCWNYHPETGGTLAFDTMSDD